MQVAINSLQKWEVGLFCSCRSGRDWFSNFCNLLHSRAQQETKESANKGRCQNVFFFLRILLLWFKIKWGKTALTFSSDLCVWHFPELLSVATSKYDIKVSLVEAALRYILLSLQDGKGIFPKSPFWFVIHTHPHSLLHHTGPIWQCCCYCSFSV